MRIVNKMLNISYRENHGPDYSPVKSLVLILILSSSVPPEEGVLTFQREETLTTYGATAEIYHF